MTRLFANTTGLGSAVPLRLFGVGLYAGCLMHFAPVVLALQDNYGPDAFRVSNWDPWLFEVGPRLPPWVFPLLAVALATGAGLGILGIRPRLAAALTAVSGYALSSLNGLNLQTLALGPLWGVLTIWVIGGGGAGMLFWPRPDRSVENRLTRGLIGYYLLLTVFIAGLEKVASGWMRDAQMARLLMYPDGTLLREGFVAGADGSRVLIGRILELATLAIELLTPLAALVWRVRWWWLLPWCGFFVGIVVVLQVPVLFFGIYAPALFLLIDDADLSLPLRQKSTFHGGSGPGGVTPYVRHRAAHPTGIDHHA